MQHCSNSQCFLQEGGGGEGLARFLHADCPPIVQFNAKICYNFGGFHPQLLELCNRFLKLQGLDQPLIHSVCPTQVRVCSLEGHNEWPCVL